MTGGWRLQEEHEDFLAWRRDLGKSYGADQVASVWVESSATGPGYIAWAHTQPEGTHSEVIVGNGQEQDRATAVEYARDWMRRNPRWPDDPPPTGLGGFDWGV